ncbi:MAG TPA: M50 family metallopeptidase [Chthonomonadaceae bacterium]|nr:M50 family metallopeptidase [Chthonomonadaceae bacterium]
MNENLPTWAQTATLRGQAIDDGEHFRTSRRLLLVATLVTLALWFVPYSNYLLYPLRLFIIFIHESGHALAALLVGGSVASLTVAPNGSGVTQTLIAPWARWLVYSGGYLGTALFGAVLLQVGRLARWRSAGRTVLYTIAFVLLALTLLWAWRSPFTLITGLALAAVMWALARYTSPQAANFAAAFLAVQCSLNALGDLSDLFAITTHNLGDSDAKFMADAYLLPPTFWAVLWAAMAVLLLAVSLRSYWRATAARRLPGG